MILHPLVNLIRRFNSTQNNFIKVAVIGACGAIGTNMSLLLKMNPLINEIIMIDVVEKITGVALDLSHISTPCKVKGYLAPIGLNRALADCNIVMITAGQRRKPGMSHMDLFNSNAKIINDITLAICETCPRAFVGVITNPVNSLVPLINSIIEKQGKGDSNRIFGVTTVDVIRAKTIIGEAKKLNPMVVDIPVIGGHSDNTVVPLISRSTPSTKFDETEIIELTNRIRNIGNDILKTKGNAGSTISMAYAGARMTSSLVRAILGEKNIVECAFVKNDSLSTKYLCLPIVIGQEGIKDFYKIDNLTDYEEELLKVAVEDLKKCIKIGESFFCK